MHQLANSKIGQLVNEMEQNSHFPFRNERRRNRKTIPIAGPTGLEINRSEKLPEKKKVKKCLPLVDKSLFGLSGGSGGRHRLYKIFFRPSHLLLPSPFSNKSIRPTDTVRWVWVSPKQTKTKPLKGFPWQHAASKMLFKAAQNVQKTLYLLALKWFCIAPFGKLLYVYKNLYIICKKVVLTKNCYIYSLKCISVYFLWFQYCSGKSCQMSVELLPRRQKRSSPLIIQPTKRRRKKKKKKRQCSLSPPSPLSSSLLPPTPHFCS